MIETKKKMISLVEAKKEKVKDDDVLKDMKILGICRNFNKSNTNVFVATDGDNYYLMVAQGVTDASPYDFGFYGDCFDEMDY